MKLPSVLLVALSILVSNCSENHSNMDADLVLVKGGTFQMGDLFGDGAEDERPVHQVTLSDFHLCKYEVTVAQFRAFVEATGYTTSAEGLVDEGERAKILEQFSSPDLTDEERLALRERFLEYAGAGYWDSEERKWSGYNSETTWKNPGIAQTDSTPVLAISPRDAMAYCNWLNEVDGLPISYELETGMLVNQNGKAASDVTSVKGYRLPTEAEWEYAAREGGRDVRFGNGKDVARSSQINFRGDEGDYDYLEADGYSGRTTPVGSFPPNSLGLYDMSGNAWEWATEQYIPYTSEPQVNPYSGHGGMYAARGGRWGGDALEARVFRRDPYPRTDRCNNTGFRIARSVQ